MIFKAQEMLKRATEAGANTELGRNLLNESLHLFQQVAECLPMDYLVSAVDNFIANQFFAGMLCERGLCCLVLIGFFFFFL